MKKNSPLLLLLVCILLGTFLRLINVSRLPPSLNWDEVSLGYNAYSLLHTGRDEWNVSFPAIFRAYGDYKLPLYIYTSVPAIALFGPDELGIRLTSIIAGIGLILISFLLAKKLLKNNTVALLSSFLVAIEPWTLFLSRVAVEANLAAFFISLGIYLGLKNRYRLSALFMGLSVWTYNSARFFAPAMILFTVIYFRHNLKRFLIPLLISAVFIVPMFIQFLLPVGQARLNWLSLLDSGAIAQIAASRATTTFPFPRLIYNKATYFASHFTSNYFSYFSPDFLFINGGSNYQFNIPHLGLMAPVTSVFFYFGIILLLFSKRPGAKFILIWLLLAPIAGSITRDSPHTLRAITMLPIPMLVSAFGLVEFSKHLSYVKYPVYVVFIAGLIYSFWQFTNAYTYSYPRNYSWSWQYGYSQVISYIKSHYSDYDEIIFTKKYGEPHEFVLFYTPWNPSTYSSDPKLVRYFRSDWFWVDGFAKYRFVNDWDMPSFVRSLASPGRYLIISSPDNPVPEQLLTRIDFLNHQSAFTISQKII
jgi:4-amino-4-deoxy-L-arabinose transferase-like glycosyltransferase